MTLFLVLVLLKITKQIYERGDVDYDVGIELDFLTLTVSPFNYLYIVFFILVFLEVRLLVHLTTCL